MLITRAKFRLFVARKEVLICIVVRISIIHYLILSPCLYYSVCACFTVCVRRI